MEEKIERDSKNVTDKNLLDDNLSEKMEVRRKLRSARRYRFPWLLIIMTLIVFMIVFVIATYFSGSG